MRLERLKMIPQSKEQYIIETTGPREMYVYILILWLTVQINFLMCSCDNSYLPKVDQIRNFCCVPSFVIGMAGPWFCILGGVFLSRAVIQPLTDFIPLTINLRVSDQVKR